MRHTLNLELRIVLASFAVFNRVYADARATRVHSPSKARKVKARKVNTGQARALGQQVRNPIAMQ